MRRVDIKEILSGPRRQELLTRAKNFICQLERIGTECRVCGDAIIEREPSGWVCPACGHKYVPGELFGVENPVIVHDNECGCDWLGREGHRG